MNAVPGNIAGALVRERPQERHAVDLAEVDRALEAGGVAAMAA